MRVLYFLQALRGPQATMDFMQVLRVLRGLQALNFVQVPRPLQAMDSMQVPQVLQAMRSMQVLQAMDTSLRVTWLWQRPAASWA